MKPIFWLGCCGCIFHGPGNSAQLWQNFGISGVGLNPPPPLVPHFPVQHLLYKIAPNYTGCSKTRHNVATNRNYSSDLKMCMSSVIGMGNCGPDWRSSGYGPLLQRESCKYYIFWVCVCSLSYAACNARVLYCHLWPAPLYHIFPHYLKTAR
jgi:hypothetical protein